MNFIINEIHPALQHFQKLNPAVPKLIDEKLKIVCQSRKYYDDSISEINKKWQLF